jgi:hypothetical protein
MSNPIQKEKMYDFPTQFSIPINGNAKEEIPALQQKLNRGNPPLQLITTARTRTRPPLRNFPEP